MSNIMRCTISIYEELNNNILNNLLEDIKEYYSDIKLNKNEDKQFLNFSLYSKSVEPLTKIKQFLDKNNLTDTIVDLYVYNSTTMVEYHRKIKYNWMIEDEAVYPEIIDDD